MVDSDNSFAHLLPLPAVAVDANSFAHLIPSAAAPAASLRDRYKAAIASGGDEQGNYPGTQTPVPGFFGLLQRRMSDPFGVQDEVVGGGKYVGSLASDLIHRRSVDWDAANRAYEEGAERIRAEKEAYAERVGPLLAVLTDIAGGFGTAKAGKATSAAQGLIERIREASKTGAAYGAISGAANAEGAPDQRILGGAYGAGIGMVAGPALSEVAAPAGTWLLKGAQNAPGAIAQGARTIIPGMRDNLDERLLAALQRQQMTPADLRAQMAADQVAQAGVNTQAPVTLADSGPAMRDLAYAIKAQPGPGKTAAEQFLEARQRGAPGQSSQYDRMANATREAFQAPQSAAAVEDALTAGRSAASNAAYDAFRAYPGTIPLEDILQAHAAEVAHAVPAQTDLVPLVDKAHGLFTNEGYGVNGVEGATRQLDALQQGREIFNADPERVAAQVGALPPAEQAPYRTGAAAEFLKRFGDKRSGNNIPDILDTPNMQTRLGAAAGQPQADKLNAYAGLEQRMAQTRNRVMGNSRTAENQALQQDFTLATRLGPKLSQGKIFGAAADAIGSTLQRLYRFREEDARLLARDLFATDPKVREATVQRLEKVYGQKEARAAVSTAVQTARGLLAKAAVAPIVNHLSPYSGEPSNALISRGSNNALISR